MRLGLFMMPLHPPTRDYHAMLEEDFEAVLHADALGFDDVWIGEHFSSTTEPITAPMMFMASLIRLTKQIKFCTGVINMPPHHPALVAAEAAMFDHMSRGRFVLGIGPARSPAMRRCSTMRTPKTARRRPSSGSTILKIWSQDPPYHLNGKYWDIVVEKNVVERLGFGYLAKPYQKPHPPIALSIMSPFRSREGGARRGWMAISANFIPAYSVASHWKRYLEGCAEAKRTPTTEWRVCRNILVADTDEEAKAYLARPDCAVRYYFYYLSSLMKRAGFAQIMKGLTEFPDEHLTVDWAIDNIVIAGSPATVAEKLLAVRQEVGPFGAIVLTELTGTTRHFGSARWS